MRDSNYILSEEELEIAISLNGSFVAVFSSCTSAYYIKAQFQVCHELCYRTQVKWILLVRAVIVQFFQLLRPQQASQFFMEKFLVENFEAAKRRGEVLLPSKITFSCIITHIMSKYIPTLATEVISMQNLVSEVMSIQNI